jgi:GcrA cell cycle regulator
VSGARAPYRTKGWPPADDALLRELWLAGVFVRRIAMALGRSRSTIICRARKIGLGPRAQPTMAMADVERVAPDAQAPVQLPMLPDPAAPGRPKVPLKLWLVPTGPVRECQWPQGEKPRMRFCFKPAFPGKPYCLVHSRIAYIGFGHPRPTGHAWVSP